MSPRGRPPLPRSVFAFDIADWVTPEAVVLDSSVVAEFLLPSQAEHAQCVSLFEKLVVRQTAVVFNRLLEVELDQVLFNAAMRDQHPGKDLRWIRADGRVRRRATRLLQQGRTKWDGLLDSLPWLRVEVQEVSDDATTLIGRYGLESYDAVHAATLLAAGLHDLVTRDSDFAYLPQHLATLHTTANRLAGTRRKRHR